MIEIDIPGYKKLQLKNLVLDYNGTLACDGEMLPGVKACLTKLAEELDIHVLTAATFGKVRSELNGIPCDLSILPLNSQDIDKLEVIERLDKRHTVCIGNGRNDRLMLEEAVLGIAVIIGDGTATECVTAADVVCSSIFSALELLSNPLRLIATLRS